MTVSGPLDEDEDEDEDEDAQGNGQVGKANNGYLDGAANGSTKHGRRPRTAEEREADIDPKIDSNPVYEFGGSWGVSAMMIGFPLLMWYMWIGATYYDGHLPVRALGQNWGSFVSHLAHLVYTGAFPSLRAWAIYWTFFIFEGICYLYMPGVYSKGKPLPHLGGKKLDYYCSGVSSFYFTIAVALVLHATGLFKLYTLMDEFGPLMSVAIISGFLVSIVAYVSALYRGAQHRMTGYPIYDFFMGAELNPRIFEWLDFKMFFEVRLPWFILFFVSLGAAARQYEQLGYVTGEVSFVLMAHFLYANACCKGEEMIVTTWYAQDYSLISLELRSLSTQTRLLTGPLGTCTTRNGALCLSFGTLPAFRSLIATAPFTLPTTLPPTTTGANPPWSSSTCLTCSRTGSGTQLTARKTCSVLRRGARSSTARRFHSCRGRRSRIRR